MKSLAKRLNIFWKVWQTFETQEQTDQILAKVQPDDVVKFGLIPEMVGRLPVVVACHNLTHNDLKEVLVKPKNAVLKQFEKMFKLFQKFGQMFMHAFKTLPNFLKHVENFSKRLAERLNLFLKVCQTLKQRLKLFEKFGRMFKHVF